MKAYLSVVLLTCTLMFGVSSLAFGASHKGGSSPNHAATSQRSHNATHHRSSGSHHSSNSGSKSHSNIPKN
jgi:hypothetical protein